MPDPAAARRVAVDAGGISLAAGGRVRAGLVYRVSGSLVREEELRGLEALRLDVLVDLRGAGESRHPLKTWAPAHGVRYEHAPIDAASPEQLARAMDEGATAADGLAHLRHIYHLIAERYAPSFARTLTLVAEPGRAGFGCAAGKDRTGILTAFLHVLLGASEEEAAEHYVALAPTPEQLAPLAETVFGIPPGTPVPPAVTALLGVRAEILLETLEQLRRRHGTLEAYLLEAGMAPEVPARLRRRLLE